MGPPPAQAGGVKQRLFASPITIRHSSKGYRIVAGNGLEMDWQLPVLEVLSDDGVSPLTLGNKSYPGDLWIHFKRGADGKPNRLLDTISHVPLETYIPGVIQKELYGSWGLEAFRAQAIAARSYFFYEKKKNNGRHYDLESTTASQVYTGQAKNPKAVTAARTTRGVVMTYQGYVLPTFYCSTSGGISQDAHGTFPGVPSLAPLRGFKQGGWGKASNRYTWSASRSTATLARRIAAWGRHEKHPVAGLSGLKAIRVKQTNSVGRPKMFELTDAQSRRYTIAAESLRQAANYAAPGLAAVTKDNRMYSAFVTVTMTSQATRLDGRGYGHGVGMCQWSAQGMSKAGHKGEQIIRFFYPGGVLRKVY